MMKQYTYNERKETEAMVDRRSVRDAEKQAAVAQICDRVKEQGDRAVRVYTEQFDGVVLDEITYAVPTDSGSQISPELKDAIDTAYGNITTFHRATMQPARSIDVETQPGVRCRTETRAIERVGLYVPG